MTLRLVDGGYLVVIYHDSYRNGSVDGVERGIVAAYGGLDSRLQAEAWAIANVAPRAPWEALPLMNPLGAEDATEALVLLENRLLGGPGNRVAQHAMLAYSFDGNTRARIWAAQHVSPEIPRVVTRLMPAKSAGHATGRLARRRANPVPPR